MPLFKIPEGTQERAHKRQMGSDGQPHERTEAMDVERRLTAMEDLTRCMGHLTVIHDVRLREMGTLFRVIALPKGSTYFKMAEEVDTKWK